MARRWTPLVQRRLLFSARVARVQPPVQVYLQDTCVSLTDSHSAPFLFRPQQLSETLDICETLATGLHLLKHSIHHKSRMAIPLDLVAQSAPPRSQRSCLTLNWPSISWAQRPLPKKLIHLGSTYRCDRISLLSIFSLP